MMEPLPSRIAALEELAAAEPDSEPRRHDLLLEYLAFPALDADPRRIAHIRWFVEHHPRATACRSPIVSLHACASPTEFASIEGVWLQHLLRKRRAARAQSAWGVPAADTIAPGDARGTAGTAATRMPGVRTRPRCRLALDWTN